MSVAKLYDYFNITLDCDIDDDIEINLIISKDGYINDISNESIYYNGRNRENFHYGEIWIEFLNLFKSPLYHTGFLPLFNNLKYKYEEVSIGFIREFYSGLLSIGASTLVAQSIVEFVLVHIFSKGENANLLDILEDDFIILAFYNPHFALNNFMCSPKTTYFQTTFSEIDGIPCLIHCGLDAASIIDIDIINCRANNINILQCEHCHKFFIQKHKNNSKYCNDCKSLPDCKRRKDDFEELYRKVYARLRNKSRSIIDNKKKDDYINGVFHRWSVEVLNKKKMYKANNDFEGFKSYIENTEKNIQKF